MDGMILPAALTSHLESSLGQIADAVRISGGDISQAARIRLADDVQLLVKWRSGSLSGLFTAERRGLELLRAAGALRIPEVLAHGEAAAQCPAFIALEWLDTGSKSGGSAEALGYGLAAQHRVLAASFGLDHDNFIGANPQPNYQDDNWASFFREQRLGFQMELAGRNGLLPTQRARRLEVLLARLDDWLPTQPPASLLHGDLWGGNWLATSSGGPALIDPAVYYGHREADLAFTELFGGFPATFYAAYQTNWPLESEYEERKELYNLYHLLNHLNLFGESYGGSLDSILRRFVG
jgi:fructosamine-3-kinase